MSLFVFLVLDFCRWHWLSGRGIKARAAHSGVYIKETDSLYVFGGYDLNQILGDLAIYKFNTSQWEDHLGSVLPCKFFIFIIK